MHKKREVLLHLSKEKRIELQERIYNRIVSSQLSVPGTTTRNLLGQPISMDFFFFQPAAITKRIEAAGFAIEDVVDHTVRRWSTRAVGRTFSPPRLSNCRHPSICPETQLDRKEANIDAIFQSVNGKRSMMVPKNSSNRIMGLAARPVPPRTAKTTARSESQETLPASRLP